MRVFTLEIWICGQEEVGDVSQNRAKTVMETLRGKKWELEDPEELIWK